MFNTKKQGISPKTLKERLKLQNAGFIPLPLQRKKKYFCKNFFKFFSQKKNFFRENPGKQKN